jgi:hypothetical protein
MKGRIMWEEETTSRTVLEVFKNPLSSIKVSNSGFG